METLSCNLAVLSGVASEVTIRILGSGDPLASFSLRVPGPSERATSVPVVCFAPPAWLEALQADTEVVVVGAVHRRFFRLASGATGSTTEVVATTVVRASERRRVAAALRRAGATIEDCAA